MIRVRKVEYTVYMDQLDEDGNIIQEMSTQQPLVAFGHQLGDIPEQVAVVVKQAEEQLP